MFVILSVFFWLPYHLRLENGFEGIGITVARTSLWQYLVIHGLFVFLVFTLLMTEVPRALWQWFRGASQPRKWMVIAVSCTATILALAAALLG